ncbi:DUF11 domain-containing protein [Romboutsia weinsteinii]|uniref:DUF11 domain-containing protein n=1 Tax=Romboutsia weinsteinii TaxID=2020949 RepID=A0A371J5V9_9FIRM|nr:DUF11 domain-containing protein [Romboutsia weinsteinii]RDY28068.1 DUF11 domain-containing protein [Romboutsia weinsteinii]
MATTKKIKNIANISYQYQPDATIDIVENASLVSPVSSEDIVEAGVPSFTLTDISHTNFLKPGNVVTYNLSIVNTGNVSFSNIVIKNDGASNLTFSKDNIKVYIDGVAADSGEIAFATNQFTITPASGIAEDKEVVALITAKDSGTGAVAGEDFANEISIGYSYKDPLNTGGADIVVAPVDAQKLNLSTTYSFANITNVAKAMNTKPQAVGGAMTYTLTLENSGNVDAINVEIKDLIPKEMTYTSVAGTKLVPGGTSEDLSLSGATDSENLLTITGIVVPAAKLVDTTLTNGEATITITGTYTG